MGKSKKTYVVAVDGDRETILVDSNGRTGIDDGPDLPSLAKLERARIRIITGQWVVCLA